MLDALAPSFSLASCATAYQGSNAEVVLVVVSRNM
jgi:hypothetical protein